MVSAANYLNPYTSGLKYYLLEGEVRHALGSYVRVGINNSDGDNFKVVISGISGFRRLLSEFFTRSNLFIHSLKITNCWLCKAPVEALITESDLVDATLRTSCWTESLPELARKLDKIAGEVESDIFDLPTRNFGRVTGNELDDVLDRHLRSLVMQDYENPCRWVLIESNGDGVPIRSDGVSQVLVNNYSLSNFHIVSIFNDFRAKTILYKINEHPFGEYAFDLNRSSDRSHWETRSVSPIVRASSVASSPPPLTDADSSGYRLCLGSDIANYSNYGSFDESSFSYYSNSFYSGIDSPLLSQRSNSPHSSCSSTQLRTPLSESRVPPSLAESVAPDVVVLPDSEIDDLGTLADARDGASESDNSELDEPEPGWIYSMISFPVTVTYGMASYVGTLFGY